MKVKRLLVIFIFILPAGLILVQMGNYAYSQTSIYSDLTISHLPYAEFIQASLRQYGQIPLWYPGLFGGTPFSSHPLSGLWYPFGWLGIILPSPYGFNLSFAIHMVMAGVGMYLFLRKEDIGTMPAILAGLAFELTPKLMAHWGAGHVTLSFAYSLTPWLFLCEAYSTRENNWRWVGITAIPVSLILLADVRWVAYAGLAWISYRVWGLLSQEKWVRRLLQWGVKTLGVILVTCMLTAPFLLGFVEFTVRSTRVLMTNSDRNRFGLPLDNLLGMLYPDFGGYAEWVFYPGALSLLLITMLLFAKVKRKRAGFWLVLLGLSLALALSGGGLGTIPLLNLLRVSSRFLFLFSFSAVVVLGIGLDLILEETDENGVLKPASWLAAAAVGSLTTLLAVAVWFGTGTLSLEIAWGATFSILSLAFMFLDRYLPLPRRLELAVLTILITLDLGVVGYSQLRWVESNQVDRDGMRIANIVAELEPETRVYSPSYQISQLAAERSNLQMISGIDPMQLIGFIGYMEGASNIPLTEYSVTIPPLTSEPISESNQGIIPNAEKMGWMNVGLIVTGEEFEKSEDWELVREFDNQFIYRNQLTLPRAWVQKSSEKIDQVISEGNITYYSPNKITVEAEGNGFLVLAEVVYPGWTAKVDGKDKEIVELAGLLRSVEIGEGRHEIVFTYWPNWLTIGLAVQFIGILLIFFAIKVKKT